jgi:hypothetical protein
MQTDEDIRAALHARVRAELDDVEPRPDLLAGVRRQYAASSRARAAAGSAAGLAVAAAAATPFVLARRTGVRVTPVAPAAASSTTPAPAVSPEPRIDVALGGYDFTLPPGFEVAEGPKSYDLTHADPWQPVGGINRWFSARRGPAADQVSISVTIGTGPIGRPGYQAEVPGTPTTVDLGRYDGVVHEFGSGATLTSGGRVVMPAGGATHLAQVDVQIAPETHLSVLGENVDADVLVKMVRRALNP